MKRTKDLALDGIAVVVGGLIWACSVNMFTLPNLIVPGGVTGISTVLYHFFGFPVGITILVLNLPLFLLSFRFLGVRFSVKTILCTAATSVIVDLCTFLPAFTEDKLLSSVFGGILSGIGLGLIYMRGMATGGTDLIALFLCKLMPFVPYGRMIVLTDAVIVVASAIVFRDLAAALYAAITIYISGMIVDNMLGGLDKGKAVYIISAQRAVIASSILSELNRGATMIEARGCYSQEEQDMLMVIVRKNELFRLKALVASIDPQAFVVITEVTEVLGNGFKLSEKNK